MSDNTSLPPPSPTGTAPPFPPMPADLAHDSLKTNIIVSASICWFIALFFVSLRFYTRGVVIKVLGGSDWCILVALIFSGATCGGIIEQATHGAGQHVWDLDPADTKNAIAWGRSAWYGILFYILTLAFSKISILLLYIHLFTFKWARLAGQTLLGLVVLSHLYMALATFTACIPLNSYWDFTVKKKYCHPQSVWWSNTGLHMMTDFLIFLLPMPVVWSIQLPKRQKFALSGVFGFGFVVCFISILRLLQLLRAQVNPDFTYVAAELSYLTVVEVNGAIVCACVMTLKPFFVKFFPGLLSSRGSRSTLDSLGRRGRTGRSVTPVYYGAGPPTIGSTSRTGGGGGGGRMRDPASPLSVLDKQYGIHRDDGGYYPSSRNWNVGGGGGGGYMEIEDDKVPVVGSRDREDSEGWGAADVELEENVSRRERGGGLGAAQEARRDYMVKRGVGTSGNFSGPVPEGVVRVETSVTIVKEDLR